MTEDHPNVTLMKRLDVRNLPAAADLFADDFVWHYFNPQLPEIAGDYYGVQGLADFFEKIAAASTGTFRVEPVSLIPMGDELVVAHVHDRLTIDGEDMVLDALAIWRIVDGRITEAWDIPAVNTPRKP